MPPTPLMPAATPLRERFNISYDADATITLMSSFDAISRCRRYFLMPMTSLPASSDFISAISLPKASRRGFAARIDDGTRHHTARLPGRRMIRDFFACRCRAISRRAAQKRRRYFASDSLRIDCLRRARLTSPELKQEAA